MKNKLNWSESVHTRKSSSGSNLMVYHQYYTLVESIFVKNFEGEQFLYEFKLPNLYDFKYNNYNADALNVLKKCRQLYFDVLT